MPSTTFSTDNIRQTGLQFPRIKLAHNEQQRIVCMEQGPHFEWQHTLRKPVLEKLTGKVKMEKKKRRDGTEYETEAMDFVSSFRCLGDPDILEDKKGVDVEHCPVCKLSKESEYFKGPERRFAIHVLKYFTQPGSFQLTEPFNVETRIWQLSETRFAKLAQLFKEWGKDARALDLLLGPCNNEGFQNYEIQAAPQCQWIQTEERKQRGVATFQGNRVEDLSPYCAQEKSLPEIMNAIEEVQAQWSRAIAAENGERPAVPDFTQTLDNSLLDTAPPAQAQTVAPPSSDVSGLDEFLPETTSNPNPAAITPPDQVAAQVAAEQQAVPPAGEDKPLDFTSLFDELK